MRNLAQKSIAAFSCGAKQCKSPKVPKMPDCSHKAPAYKGPSYQQLVEKRKKFLNPAYFHYYSQPMFLHYGYNQYMWDEKGRRYLDCFSGIATVSVGYNHPKYVKAINDQAKLLTHTPSLYLHDQITLYAEELAKKMPKNLSCFFFTNSGSEANDLALNLIRAHTKNFDILNLRNAYHGTTSTVSGILGIRSWKYQVPSGFGIHSVKMPNPYRGEYGNNGAKYAEDIVDVINSCTSGTVAGFIAEPIQGVGGAILLADGYLKKAYEIVRAAGGLCIADEVQTGFGRTGKNYWGFQNHGVVPDIVTMAKGVANGTPLGVVATTPEIGKSLASRLYFNTFGGNPVSAAAARAVLKIIDEDKLMQNCDKVGTHIINGMKELMKKHKVIGDVRGQGLAIGIELVSDRKTKAPLPVKDVNIIFEKALKLGCLLGKAGLPGNVIRIFPPYCISKADADFLLQVMDQSMEGY